MDDICASMEKLLRRGERYQAPQALRHIALKQQWSWSEEQSTYIRSAVVLSKAKHLLCCNNCRP